MKFIIWIKESRTSEWSEQGDGPLTRKQADRIAREVRSLCFAVTICPVGSQP